MAIHVINRRLAPTFMYNNNNNNIHSTILHVYIPFTYAPLYSTNLKKDISEYVLGFLDSFAYKWLESLEKGDKSFTLRRFERKFREKFKYLVIKEGKWPVKE